jgi:replicative DNA helicase
MEEKLPPHDRDAEEAVVGSLLIDPDALVKISFLLKPEDFFYEENAWVYEACLTLYDRSEGINQITVASELARRGRLDSVGGSSYLSHLVSQVPTSLQIEYYAQIVYRTSMMRKLIAAGGQIAAIGYEASPDVDDAFERAEDILFQLQHGEISHGFSSLKDVLGEYFDEIVPSSEGHIDCGFPALDETLGGLQRSDMVILASRPSMGKSSFMLNVACNAALEHKFHVAIFSLEMSKEQIVQRLLSANSGVDSKKIRLGFLSPKEEEKIAQAAGVLSEAPVFIDDSPFITVREMRGKIRKLHHDERVDLIFVDYLQLIQGDGRWNRVQEMGEISRQIKGLAREINVPLIAISQLSRAVETRTPHIPILSDLRESGSIEQEADIVLFIYRDDFYYSPEEWEKASPEKPYPKGIAQIIVAKHRNGPTGKVDLFFEEKSTQFFSLERRRVDQPSLPWQG